MNKEKNIYLYLKNAELYENQDNIDEVIKNYDLFIELLDEESFLYFNLSFIDYI